MPLLAASLESLIAFAVILLLSALGNWLKNRKAQAPEGWDEEETPASTPRPPGQPAPGPGRPPAPANPVFDLERELRRMFGQEPEPPPPTAPHQAPPVLAPKPAPAPTSVPTQPPPAWTQAAEEEFVPVPLPAGTHFPKSARAMGETKAPEFELAHLTQAKAAYRRASSLEKAVRTELDSVRPGVAHVAQILAPRRGAASPELASVLASLKQPRAARQVILASVILGPPRGLDR